MNVNEEGIEVGGTILAVVTTSIGVLLGFYEPGHAALGILSVAIVAGLLLRAINVASRRKDYK